MRHCQRLGSAKPFSLGVLAGGKSHWLTSSLRPVLRVPIILETCSASENGWKSMSRFKDFGKRIDEEVSKIRSIDSFEDFGKQVDEKLANIKQFVSEDVAPETEKRTAQFLREVSEKLSEAAGWLEKRRAAKEGSSTKESS